MKFDLKYNRTTISLFILLLLIIDQASKVVIKLTMSIGQTIYVIGNWFQIKFIENPGAAYGFEIADGEWGKLTLTLVRIVAIIALSYYINILLRRRAPQGVLFGFAIILAGAIGNVIDSLFYGLIFTESTMWDVAKFVPWGEGYTSFMHGKVVDMLYFPIIDTWYPKWVPFVGGNKLVFFSPIFNIADTYISIGFLYLIIFKRKYFNKE